MHQSITYKSTKLTLFVFVSAWAGLAQAEFVPIVLMPGSFNQDIVVERTASAPLVPVTTATMEGGIANGGYTWYERGFQRDFAASGLLAAGSTTTSEAAGDHEYLFAPRYTDNNALMIDSDLTSGALTLTDSSTYSVLSFLVSGGNGGGSIAYTLRHQDGSTQTDRLLCRDWLNGQNPAFTAAGRINVTTFTFDMDNTNPRLYAVDIGVTNKSSPVESVAFSYISGSGHAVVFALSGAEFQGDLVRPIPVTGYNVDLIVEANSTQPDPLTGFTTATMDDGESNMGNTWYEAGYYPPAPTTGLPAGGSWITSETSPDHRFALAESFTSNNVVLLDAAKPDAALIPKEAARYSALSFLTSAGHGPVTNRCVVNHADGSSETNTIISPDWLDARPMAFCGNGRVKIGKRLVDKINANDPRLFAVDCKLDNTISPVTNILMSFTGGGLNSHAAIFAVSGAGNSEPPTGQRARLSIGPGNAGTWIISSTEPGRLQSTTELKGVETVWTDEGVISGAITVPQVAKQPARFYRVMSP